MVHYKNYVGKQEDFDIIGAKQFSILTKHGLRAYHKMLDIGCGCLRAGRFFIQYLDKGNYYGIEPNEWLVEDAVKNETGEDLIRLKSPNISYNHDFNLNIGNVKFDFILAHSIFCHASLFQIEKVFSQAKKCLKEDGRFFFTFIPGHKDNNKKKWTYPQGVEYTWKTIKSLVIKYNFYTLYFPLLEKQGNQVWVVLHA